MTIAAPAGCGAATQLITKGTGTLAMASVLAITLIAKLVRCAWAAEEPTAARIWPA